MSYATPTQYLARYGADEATQLLADEESLLTKQLLLDAIAVAAGGTWTGTPTVDERAAATACLARLQRALDNASNLMNGHISSVYALPLAVTPDSAGTLEECCLALARVSLADDSENATERMDHAADNWRDWLRQVAARKVQLILANGGGQEASNSAATIHVGQAVSNVNWGSFGGVR